MGGVARLWGRGTWAPPVGFTTEGHQLVTSTHLILALSVWTGSATGAAAQRHVTHGRSSHAELGVQKDPDVHEVELQVSGVPRQAESVVPELYFKGPPDVNRHRYTYIINNPDVCVQQQDILLLSLIRTVIGHVDRRMAIRDSWGASYNLPSVAMPTVFLLGAARTEAEQKEIDLESRIYRDVIQEDFADTYHNLTLKTVMAYKWASTYCRHAHFVMVGNDDMVVDTFKLVTYLQSVPFKNNNQFVICYLFPCCMMAEKTGPVEQLNTTGWNVYVGKAYPAYCSSSMYVAPSAVIHQLYLMSRDTPSFMPDEPWVGVLAEKLGVTFCDMFHSYVGVEPSANLLQSFNVSDYLHTPLLVGITGRSAPQREAETIRKAWSVVVGQHRDSPPLDVRRYMGHGHVTEDSHIYQVALAALLIDLGVMALIGYIIFCRKRQKNVSHHPVQHSYPR